MRRINDTYFTGDSAVQALKDRVEINGWIYEPCAGNGAIAKHFKQIIENDINAIWPMNFDATKDEAWNPVALRDVKWVITNPPFNVAFDILQQAFKRDFKIAFLLRLSFLEPTYERQEFLNAHPPTKLIVLPRFSFTGDGKTDSVTCAWMIWNYIGSKSIEVVMK